MTKTESAHLTGYTVLIESAEQVLQLHSAAGVRLAIPDTDALIMVGPADWIAKNVPGVDAMVEGALTDEQIVDVARAAVAARRLSWLGFGKDEHGRYTVPTLSKCHYDFARAIECEVIARLAATTQASTAQGGELAKPSVERSELANCSSQVMVAQASTAQAERDAVLEEAALLCEAVASDKYDQYKGRGKYAANNPHRADTYTSGESDGADLCADKIRALIRSAGDTGEQAGGGGNV